MEPQPKNEILLTGASGLLGQAITSRLKSPWKALHHGEPGWDPENGICNPDLVKDSSAVIHLAGEPIAARRWSPKQKQKIYDSRVNGTRALAEALAGLETKPECLICASAIGFYGNRGEELLTENSPPGEGYLSKVVRDWESAADPARQAGIRVVHLRLGMILSAQGGALSKMLPPFKWGLGGKLGSGRMWMSWIHEQDAARAFDYALTNPEISGALNLTAPRPVRNIEFTQTLAETLKKPAILPAPAFLIKALLGEMGEELLLGSTRCPSEGLQKHKFDFRYQDLKSALNQLLRDEG